MRGVRGTARCACFLRRIDRPVASGYPVRHTAIVAVHLENRVNIRSLSTACAMAAGLAASVPASAQQSVMSINHVVTYNMPHHECMRRGSQTLAMARLNQFGTTSEAVWGETYDRMFTAVIYCLTTRDVAVMVVNGPDRGVTHNLVEDLVSAWNRSR
jgi:hypothetical protein